VFEAVFDQVSLDLCRGPSSRAHREDVLAMVAGTQHYFAACAKPTGQIICDGPAVLGWGAGGNRRPHFGGKIPLLTAR
jgi:hypothetical protein